MNKVLLPLSLFVCLLTFGAFAEYVAVQRDVKSVSTSATPSTDMTLPVIGLVKEIHLKPTTSNMWVNIKTTNGIGSSLVGQKTLLDNMLLPAGGLATQITSTVNLYGDRIVVSVTNAAASGTDLRYFILLSK